MIVKNIVISAGDLLGIGDQVRDEIEKSEDSKIVQCLLKCYNIVENELAVDYFPLLLEETFSSDTGALYFESFSKKPVRIVKVVDAWENEIPFKLFPNFLKTQTGKVCVRYAYEPEEKKLQSKGEVSLHVSERLIAYGVASEYALASGLFEEASAWDKKYKDAISAVYRANPARKISARRWV